MDSMVCSRKRLREEEEHFYSEKITSQKNLAQFTYSTNQSNQYSGYGCNNYIHEKNYSISNSGKRIQQNKIHTEGHQKTIEMMMNAAKNLAITSKLIDTSKLSETSSDHFEEIENHYTQRPFW
jgi:hypothetical protein